MSICVLSGMIMPNTNLCVHFSIYVFLLGVHSIAYAFPGVRIVTTALDPEINEKFYVLPGIGNFGDRYFGTEPTEES